MNWTYDLEASALYIGLSDTAPAEQVEMPDGTIVDLDAAGHVRGIEVLSPQAPWDLNAVVDRFALDRETVASIVWIAFSPLMQFRPIDQVQDGAGQTLGAAFDLPEHAVTGTSSFRVLAAA